MFSAYLQYYEILDFEEILKTRSCMVNGLSGRSIVHHYTIRMKTHAPGNLYSSVVSNCYHPIKSNQEKS